MNVFSWKKNTLSSSYFLIFPTLKIFWIFLSKKNLIIRAEKTILNKTIRYAFYSKFDTFSDFEKNSRIFSEKLVQFFWKNPNFERFEKSY